MQISPTDFAWDRATIATLRHSTLPWLDGLADSMELPATQLIDLGARDRLSLVAQFAAHQALLQFAGIADGEVDPAEWSVVRRRGTDARLLRIAARACSSDEAPPALTLVQQFAEAIGAPPTDVMRQSWARPDAVYAEIDARLRDDAAADLRWLRHSAASEVLAPGVSGLRALWSERGRYSCGDPSAIDAVRTMASLDRTSTLIVLGGHASPLRRYSALTELTTLAGSFESLGESEVAERVIAVLANKVMVFAIVQFETFDSGSRRVVELLSRADTASWLLPADVTDTLSLPDARHFVIAPQLPARRAIGERLVQLPTAHRRAWLESFVQSPQFAAYLDDAVLPQESAPQTLASLTEPRRSYVAALALLGSRVPSELALRFLSEFLFHGTLEELLVEGVSTLDADGYSFCNEHVRAQAASLIPASSRAALCEVAARVAEESGNLGRAATLLLDAGQRERAIALLERVEWSSAEERVRTLRNISGLSPRLARSLGDALVDCGRYRDARELAPRLADADRELLLACTERRSGDYAPALARLERLSDRGFEAELLRGELLYLHGRDDEAARAFAACMPEDYGQRVRLDYAQGVLAVEAARPFAWPHGSDYLGARLATYVALGNRDFERAFAEAGESFERATTLPERIDAALDRTFVLFTAGRWTETRAAAVDALSLVEETQGDRAAGGILFTLAYLAADDGQWAHAARRIHRLRHFYSGTHDERRLAELDLLAAHLDFSRGRFGEARGAAVVAANGRLPEQIREAARLILDELDAIEGRASRLRSTGSTSNVELTDRHRLLRMRRGEETGAIVDPFPCALAAWRNGDPPHATTRSEQLKLFRVALTMHRGDVTEPIARALGIELEPVSDASDEVRILRAAALAEFPFAPHALNGARWRLASRNRLGHWTVIGSEAPQGTTASEELDRILAGGATDWVACSDRELLNVESLSHWSHESRDALAAIVRIRAEHHRLRRVVEQEEGTRASTRADSVDGIVGDSAPMREIFARITRVARRDVAVCILGESGTGKELVARALHRHSPRRSKPFTAVNCAALPENLIESELFGHMRGAFTGADRDRAGLIETSDGGTLFLDEIGEMPLAAQAKLLRFLQEGEFRRVGDTTNRTADVRIVSATNRKLESAVEDGRFREDLYYRIRGVEVALPPLRERAGDIVLLATHFLAHERDKHRSGPTRLSVEVESLFASYPWPGNVRELQNAIRAAHAMAGDANAIEVEHLPERMRNMTPTRAAIGSYQDAVTRFRRDLIEKSLLEVRGNQNQCAVLLKMSRQALAYQIRELGILVGKQR